MLFCQLDLPNKSYTHKSQALLFHLICHTPIVDSTRHFFQRVDDEKHKNTFVAMFLLCYRQQYLPDGGVQWLLVKPWTSPVHLRGRQNGQQSWSIFLLSFFLILPWQPLGQYRVSSCPMAVSSGSRGSPWHAPSGDVLCIALPQCHGHQNGWRMRYILWLLPTFFLTPVVAKDHVMVN